MSEGYVTQVTGPVVDVKFDGKLPALNNALELNVKINEQDEPLRVVLE
ncbi:F0F1 ATP synthase subunit beta, partial [Salmonella enterica subsp. enterica serovar Typhimurium]